MRAFLDAHVIFSAAYQDRSDLLIFFDLARAGHVELTTSAFDVEEARSNLARKRPDRAGDCERLIDEIPLAPAPATDHLAIAEAAGLPPKDTPILAAALAADADLLVTGDRVHFGRLFGRPIGRLTVLRPAEALATIIRSKRPGPASSNVD